MMDAVGGGGGGDGDAKPQTAKLPQKRLFRQRAHANPLSEGTFDVPKHPRDFDWTALFPQCSADAPPSSIVDFADLGCGFGGMSIRLAELFPDKITLGMEIRSKVTEYVREKIKALRENHPGQYNNVGVVRTNTMRYLPNYFCKGQLSKMFFLFPDPHFKKSNHRRRIINTQLLAEYAYVMKIGGILYTITDVAEVGEWIAKHLDSHPLFAKLTQEELDADIVVSHLARATEEGQKVLRNGGMTHTAVYKRIAAPGSS